MRASYLFPLPSMIKLSYIINVMKKHKLVIIFTNLRLTQSVVCVLYDFRFIIFLNWFSIKLLLLALFPKQCKININLFQNAIISRCLSLCISLPLPWMLKIAKNCHLGNLTIRCSWIFLIHCMNSLRWDQRVFNVNSSCYS